MLNMPQELEEKVSPDMTIKQVREMKKQAKAEKQMVVVLVLVFRSPIRMPLRIFCNNQAANIDKELAQLRILIELESNKRKGDNGQRKE